MPVEEISSYRRDEFDFILERKESTGRSITTLYFQGQETALWERSYDSGGMIETEREKRGDEITERVYQRGVLTEEITSSPDGRKEMIKYSYRNGQLTGIERSVDDAAVPETILDYRIGPDGRLLGVRQTEGEKESRTTDYFYQNNDGYGEWHEREGRAENYQFRGSRPVLQEQWNNGALLERVVWTDEEGKSLRISEFPGEERLVFDLLDDSGLLLGQEERTPEGSIFREFVYQDDNLIQLTERRPGEKRRYTYVYGPEGLTEERMERNDLLATRIIYLADGRERHETYRRGTLLMAVEYQDGIPLESDR